MQPALHEHSDRLGPARTPLGEAEVVDVAQLLFTEHHLHALGPNGALRRHLSRHMLPWLFLSDMLILLMLRRSGVAVKRLERLAHIEHLALVVDMVDENKTERVQLLMTPSEVKAIDDWSFENRIRGRAEAMRRLCNIGIDAHGRIEGLREQTRDVFWGFSKATRRLYGLPGELTDIDRLTAVQELNDRMHDLVELMAEITTMQSSYSLISTEEIEMSMEEARTQTKKDFARAEEERRARLAESAKD